MNKYKVKKQSSKKTRKLSLWKIIILIILFLGIILSVFFTQKEANYIGHAADTVPSPVVLAPCPSCNTVSPTLASTQSPTNGNIPSSSSNLQPTSVVTPSSPSTTITPCSTSQSTVSEENSKNSSSNSQSKVHASSQQGFLQQLFQFLIQFLQLLLQLLGIQQPGTTTSPCPTTSPSPIPQTTPSISSAVSPASPTQSIVSPTAATAINPTSAPTASSPCTNPTFTTTDTFGSTTNNGFTITNDVWGSGAGPQTMNVCSFNSWNVVSTQSGGGNVKSYPNVFMNYNQALSSFKTITSSFADSGPASGSWEAAYDIWANGFDTSGSTEIMIWNDVQQQTPAGSQVGTTTFSGKTWNVFKGTGGANNNIISFVINGNETSGTVDILAMFKYLDSQGLLPLSSTLSQIDYGFEIVSTNGAADTFTVSNFSLTTN
jgi:hypothetical protein